MHVDFEVFLHEGIARRLPEYEKAQTVIDDFFSVLRLQDAYVESITEYIASLETFVPKLAHYYGYMLGNDILHDLVPGYFPDTVLTMRYQSMLECYFGQPFGDL